MRLLQPISIVATVLLSRPGQGASLAPHLSFPVQHIRNIAVRFWNALALTVLIGCLAGLSTAEGSIAARVQAATAAKSQTAVAETTAAQSQTPRTEHKQLPLPNTMARDVPPRELAFPTLEGPQSDGQEPASRQGSRHTTGASRHSGQAARINVADWFNTTASEESSEPLKVVPIEESGHQPAAGQPLATRDVSSRRKTTFRISLADETPLSEPPLSLSATADKEQATEPRSTGTSADEDELGEPAILAAADGKPIEPHSEKEATPPVSQQQPKEKAVQKKASQEKADPGAGAGGGRGRAATDGSPRAGPAIQPADAASARPDSVLFDVLLPAS